MIDGSAYTVDVADLEIDEIVLVKPGERIPVDGIVVEGVSIVNESSFTGESTTVTKSKGSQVWAGTNNGNGQPNHQRSWYRKIFSTWGHHSGGT